MGGTYRPRDVPRSSLGSPPPRGEATGRSIGDLRLALVSSLAALACTAPSQPAAPAEADVAPVSFPFGDDAVADRLARDPARALLDGASDVETKKTGFAECVPDNTACNLACVKGYHCELVQVYCITTPCDPVPECVADAACTDAECGVAPKIATQLCADGTTAGPVCGRDASGTCGWTITTCP